MRFICYRVIIAVFSSVLMCGYFVPASAAVLNEETQKIFNQHLDAGFNAYVDGDYAAAISDFQKALQINPKDKTAKTGLEKCEKKLKQQKTGIEKEDQKSLKFAEDFARREKWMNAIDLLHAVLSRSPKQEKALKIQNEIGPELRQKKNMQPVGTKDYLFYEGMIHYYNQRHGEALKIWKEALLKDPDDVKLTVLIEKAEQKFRESAHYEIVVVGSERAKSDFDSGNYESAMNRWKKILEFDPANQEAQKELARTEEMFYKKNKESLIGEHYDKGLSLFLENNLEESLNEWESIIAVDPDNEIAKDYIKRIKEKGVKRAVIPASKKREPASVSISSNVAVKDSFLQKKDVGSSVLVPDETVPSDESSAGSSSEWKNWNRNKEKNLMRQGIEFYKNGQYQESVSFFELCLKNASDHTEAKEWLLKVKKEQSEVAEKHFNEGLVAYSQDRIDEAVKEWQTAIEIFPDHAASRKALNKVKKNEKNISE